MYMYQEYLYFNIAGTFLHISSSGCRSGSIHHHDIRVANHHIGTLVNHTQEVCGLSWADDGRYLASGGNDNMLNIWDGHMIMTSAANPVHALTRHQAAVKVGWWNYRLCNYWAVA